jgi:hypothetical protein
VSHLFRIRAALFLVSALASRLHGADGDPAILELRIVEGDGTAYSTGSRATRGVTVQVSDESGRPVSGATVSFTLPQDGPGGVFVSGGRTEIVTTRADGRATVWGMQWNRTPGPFEIRITAAKGQARAGILCPLYLNEGRLNEGRLSSARPGSENNRVRSSDEGGGANGNASRKSLEQKTDTPPERTASVAARASAPDRRVGTGGHRWLWIVVGAAGVAVAGAAAIGRASGSSSSSTAAAVSSLQIGTPSVSLGRP